MNLYLLRHGEAVSRSYIDAARQLTPRGEEDIANVAKQFANLNLSVGCCLCSPFKRAQQTAEIFLKQSGINTEVELTEILTPENRAVKLVDYLSTCTNNNILLVSHNPVISELLAMLTTGDISQMQILGTGHLAAVTTDFISIGAGTTSFILTPDAADIMSS